MNWLDILVPVGLLAGVGLLIAGGVWWQLWVTRKVRAWSVRRYKALEPQSRQELSASLQRVPGGKKFIERAERDIDRSG